MVSMQGAVTAFNLKYCLRKASVHHETQSLLVYSLVPSFKSWLLCATCKMHNHIDVGTPPTLVSNVPERGICELALNS